jgi:hypothetical protein
MLILATNMADARYRYQLCTSYVNIITPSIFINIYLYHLETWQRILPKVHFFYLFLKPRIVQLRNETSYKSIIYFLTKYYSYHEMSQKKHQKQLANKRMYLEAHCIVDRCLSFFILPLCCPIYFSFSLGHCSVLFFDLRMIITLVVASLFLQ